MSAIYRLTAVACQEVADVKQSEREVEDLWEEITEDLVITPDERQRMACKLRQLKREVEEAIVVIEEADYVEAEYEYRKKRGMSAEPHQYLREREHDIREMGGLEDYPPKKPTQPAGAIVRFTIRKKATAETVAKRRTQSDQG